MSLYLATGNEARILRAYQNRDPHLAANVITPYSTFLGVYAGINATLTSRWPYRLDAATNGDLRTETPTLFYYLYRKFIYESSTETVKPGLWTNRFSNYPICRCTFNVGRSAE